MASGTGRLVILQVTTNAVPVGSAAPVAPVRAWPRLLMTFIARVGLVTGHTLYSVHLHVLAMPGLPPKIGVISRGFLLMTLSAAVLGMALHTLIF